MESLPERDRLLKEVVTRAVTSPVSLFLATTGVLLAASPIAWPVGIGVLILDAGWIWARIRDPLHAQNSSEELLRHRWREAVTRLEALTGLLDPHTAGILAEILDAQERLLGMYDQGTRLLPNTRAELTSLLQHCLSLAERRLQLQSYLLGFSRQDVQHEVSRLQARIDQTSSLATQQLYQQALDQKQQELDNYGRLGEAIDRIDGQLAVVQCTFDNILSRLVRMQSADRLVETDAPDPVFEELNQLTSRVATLEESLEETLTLRAGR